MMLKKKRRKKKKKKKSVTGFQTSIFKIVSDEYENYHFTIIHFLINGLHKKKKKKI